MTTRSAKKFVATTAAAATAAAAAVSSSQQRTRRLFAIVSRRIDRQSAAGCLCALRASRASPALATATSFVVVVDVAAAAAAIVSLRPPSWRRAHVFDLRRPQGGKFNIRISQRFAIVILLRGTLLLPLPPSSSMNNVAARCARARQMLVLQVEWRSTRVKMTNLRQSEFFLRFTFLCARLTYFRSSSIQRFRRLSHTTLFTGSANSLNSSESSPAADTQPSPSLSSPPPPQPPPRPSTARRNSSNNAATAAALAAIVNENEASKSSHSPPPPPLNDDGQNAPQISLRDAAPQTAAIVGAANDSAPTMTNRFRPLSAIGSLVGGGAVAANHQTEYVHSSQVRFRSV